MAERHSSVALRTETVGGSITLKGLRRGSHEGWQASMTPTFADQVASEALGYRFGSDETTFADAAQLAGEHPPLSTDEAGILYAAIHRAINARANNKGVES